MRTRRKRMLAGAVLCAMLPLAAWGCTQEGGAPALGITSELAEAADYAAEGWNPEHDCRDCHRNFREADGDDLGVFHLNAPYHAGTCLDCHENNRALQLAHEEADPEGLPTAVDPASCLSCHSGPYAPDQAEASGRIVDGAGEPVNPHRVHPRALELTCLDCHRGHDGAADQQSCQSCHGTSLPAKGA